MTEKKAITVAKQLAKTTGETYFIVWEDGEYYACSEYDLVTFYQGIDPSIAVDPDGTTHY
jgi:hypothetical protein